jgi:hypothetical protein
MSSMDVVTNFDFTHDFNSCFHFTCRAPGAAYNHLQAARGHIKEIQLHRCTETSRQCRRERFTVKGRRSASPTTARRRSRCRFWCPLLVLNLPIDNPNSC